VVYAARVTDDNRVVVIGTGPPGAAAAVFLRRAGIQVLLLEAGSERSALGLTLRVRGLTLAKRRAELQQRAGVAKTADPQKPDQKRGLTLTDGDAPLLNIHTNEIALFPVTSQTVLQSITGQLGIYNQQVAYLRRLFDKTFDDLTDINRENVQQNLEQGYEYLAQRSISIANEIKDVPPSLTDITASRWGAVHAAL